MSYEDEYDYEEMYDRALEDATEEIRSIETDDDFINISFKKELINQTVREAIEGYCTEQTKQIKKEAIEMLKKQLIEDKFNEVLEQELRKSIKEQTDLIINDFMDRKITVSDGYWSTKTITCKECVENDIEKFLKEDLKGNIESFIKNTVDYRTKDKIDRFERSLRDETRNRIDDLFNQTTKSALSDQLFYILSQNETYKKLQAGINNLIEDK